MDGAITISLTAEEKQNVLALFDLACKAGGLQAATVAVPLVEKIRNAERGTGNAEQQ